MVRPFISSSLLLSSRLLIGCGDDGGSDPIDAKTVDTAAANCTVSSAAFGERGALAGVSFYAAGMTAGVGDIRVEMPLEAAQPNDTLLIQFFTGFAPFGTPQAPTAIVPGTYQISGAQLNYATCSVCVLIGTNVTGQGSEDDYMATGGTVTVTQVDSRVGGTLALSVSNLTFEHVTVNMQPPFDSTPVGDGCNSAVTSATHSSVMRMQPAKPSQATAPASGKRARL